VYNRVRDQHLYSPGRSSWTQGLVHTVSDDGSGLCLSTGSDTHYSTIDTVYPLEYCRGTISDTVFPRAPRLRRSRLSPTHHGMPRVVKPVHHTYVRVRPARDDITIVQSNPPSGSPCVDESTLTQTCNPFAFLCSRLGADYVKDNILDILPLSNSDTTFAIPDWISLRDEFDEGLKSLIPANFFSGEAFAEGSIYLDAIRLVLSPKKTITSLIKDVLKRGNHRLRLGELNTYYKKLFSNKTFLQSESSYTLARDLGILKHGVRETASAHLNFKFGVVPAITDLRSTIAAHSKVQSRLDFLNRHRGQYVPIRAKRTLPATFTPSTFTSPFLDFGSVYRKAYTIATIFGMGRIRSDINEASRWRAYSEYFGLNKVVGTAWELIPFSFVVDWFTNSQERINSLTRIPLGESPFMNLVSIGSSVKNVGSYDYVCNSGYDLTNGWSQMEPDSQFPCFSYEITDYTRDPFVPDTSGFVDLSSLGLFQAVTGGELLIQKFL